MMQVRVVQAEVKRHSTFPEALGIAAQCRAGHVALTHFSQRYPQPPECLDMSQCFAAQDGMHLPLSQLSAALAAQCNGSLGDALP